MGGNLVDAQQHCMHEVLELHMGWGLDHANKVINIHFQKLGESGHGSGDVWEGSWWRQAQMF